MASKNQPFISESSYLRLDGVAALNTIISTAKCDQAPEISELVRESFIEFVAPDWEIPARETFLKESSAEALRVAISEGEYSAVAFRGVQMVGFIHLSNPSVMSMLFVHPAQLRKGIGCSLWHSAMEHLSACHPGLGAVELNASPYAVAAYSAMGFQAIGQRFTKGGCSATRMAYFFKNGG